MATTIQKEFTNQGLDAPVTREEVSLPSPEELIFLRQVEDDASLKILKQDTERGESDKFYKDMTQQWTVSDQLLQQPWLTNYYYNPGKSNIPRYTLSNIIDVVTVKIHDALFFDDPPFMLRPNPKIDQKVMWAKQVVLATQLREMDFDIEADKGWFQCAHLGTQIYKYGWEDREEKQPVYKRKADPEEVDTPLGTKSVDTPESDEFELVMEPVEVHRPWLKWRDLRYLLVAPTWSEGDIRKAAWVIDRDYPTFAELDVLRNVPGYEIPSRDELEELFFPPEGGEDPAAGSVDERRPIQMRAWIAHAEGREVNDTADPLGNKIELLERWDKYRVTVALRNKWGYLLIRNELHGNVDDSGNPSIPYLSSNWRNLPANGFGQGLGQLIGPDQQVEKGTLCAYLDILSFVAKPSYVRQKPLNQPGQNEVIDLGKIISVEGPVNEYMKLLEQPKIDGNLINAIEGAKSSAASTSGANELLAQGNTVGGGRATGMRSGTGAQEVGQAQAGRLDGPLVKFVRQVLIPFLYIADRMNAERLPTRTLRNYLDKDTKDYMVDHIAWRNAKPDYEILAGTALGARKQMASFAPQLAAIIGSPAIMQAADNANLVFQVENYLNFLADLAGYKYVNPFFRQRTTQEKQEQMQKANAAQQMKNSGAMQLEALKQQGTAQNINDTQIGKAANEVLRHSLEAEFSDEE